MQEQKGKKDAQHRPAKPTAMTPRDDTVKGRPQAGNKAAVYPQNTLFESGLEMANLALRATRVDGRLR